MALRSTIRESMGRVPIEVCDIVHEYAEIDPKIIEYTIELLSIILDLNPDYITEKMLNDFLSLTKHILTLEHLETNRTDYDHNNFPENDDTTFINHIIESKIKLIVQNHDIDITKYLDSIGNINAYLYNVLDYLEHNQ